MSDFLENANKQLAYFSPYQRIEWAFEHNHIGQQVIQSTSFGLQSSAMLTLVNEVAPNTPVFFVNTGYLFPETLAYAETLTKRLNLNLIELTPTWTPEKIKGELGEIWNDGPDGIETFNQITKLDPMKEALDTHKVGFWLSGIRKNQSSSRSSIAFLVERFNVLKLHPILDWTDKDLYSYLSAFSLPLHPLEGKGYASVGDTVTTRSLFEVDSIEQTRFMGFKRECGLHA
jgi:phosphoadenosine phosphosulfate reductase